MGRDAEREAVEARPQARVYAAPTAGGGPGLGEGLVVVAGPAVIPPAPWPEVRARLLAANPCEQARKWLSRQPDDAPLSEVVARCPDVGWLLWALGALDPYGDELRGRLVAAGEAVLDAAEPRWRTIPVSPRALDHGGTPAGVYTLAMMRGLAPNVSVAAGLAFVMLCAERRGVTRNDCAEVVVAIVGAVGAP